MNDVFNLGLLSLLIFVTDIITQFFLNLICLSTIKGDIFIFFLVIANNIRFEKNYGTNVKL